jgi:hypothetical protein
MCRRGCFWLVIAVAFWTGSVEPSLGVELGRLLPSHSPCRRPAYAGNPQALSAWGQSAGVPAPHRYPEYERQSPWYGYGFGVPTYSWGWFGATYRPAVNCHRGYYGGFTQWGYRRGY